MSFSPFNLPFAAPFYPQYPIFSIAGGFVRQWEYGGWKKESLSWKDGCYLHAGLSGMGQIAYSGPDANAFLSRNFVNDFDRFRTGTAKHAIACDERGLIAGHGVLQKLGNEEYCLFVSGLWSQFAFSQFDGDVEQVVKDDFLFQVAGPTSLATLEDATGQSLREIGYLRFKTVAIDGVDVQIMRLGMAGTLAYEVHGPSAEAARIFDFLLKVGQPHRIEPLGWQTFQVNHVEGGYPQQFWTFASAMEDHAEFQDFANNLPFQLPKAQPMGSVDPTNMRARYRTPQEVGWQRSVVFNHDFRGRDALELEAADPKRTTVTLEWNSDDVVEIYRSLFEQGEEFKYLEIPVSPANRGLQAHADYVSRGDQLVGVSSGTVYSYYYRKFISHCMIDLDQANIGNEVDVHWGDYGGRIKRVRARVARFPYLDEGRNKDLKL